MDRKDNPLFSHLLLKSLLSLGGVLLTSLAAVPLSYFYRENVPALLSALIPLHVVEILSFVFLAVQLFLAGRKNPRLSFLKHLLWLLLLAVVLLGFLESHLISG